MKTTDKMDNLLPYSMDNYAQLKLQEMGKDVESFVNQMDSMSDEEIASELGVSVLEARDMKREIQRGQTGGTLVVD